MKKRPVFLIILIVMLFFVSAVQPAFALDKWGNVTDMINIALAAGSLLIYNTVWQVNNSVNGLVGDAHAVYEAINADITPKIIAWWNNLSSEDQQAYIDKVQTDEDLMVSEAIPQEIITNIVQQSVGYAEGFADVVKSDRYVMSNGMFFTQADLTLINNQGADVVATMVYLTKIYNGNQVYSLWKDYQVIDGMQRGYAAQNPYYAYEKSMQAAYWGTTLQNSSDWIIKYDYRPYGEAIFNNDYEFVPASVAYENYNPDDQQIIPFYYPVNNLNLADVWDIGTASDSDLQADTAIYAVVEAEAWDASQGVAESAIGLSMPGDTLLDNDTGLPIGLGAVKPWEVSASDAVADTGTETEIDINSESIDWAPIRDLGMLLTNKFPFCLPFDVYDIFNAFVIDSPEAPAWTWNFDGNDVVIDLNYLDPLVEKIRPIELAVMSIGFYWLVFKTLSS